MNALKIPGVAKMTIGRDITDHLKLPDYNSQK